MKTLLRFSTLLLFSLFISACTHQVVPKTYTVLEYYDRPTEEIITDAKAGNPHAQIVLGTLYGIGIPPFEQDVMKAEKWFLKGIDAMMILADKGNPAALTAMGEFYLKGIEFKLNVEQNIPQDVDKAFSYLEQAAAQGDFIASLSLAHIYQYECGRTIPCNTEWDKENQERAAYWYKQAIPLLVINAEQSHYMLQCQLSNLYKEGAYIEQNLKQAEVWARKCTQGLRHHMATLDQHPLNISVAFSLFHARYSGNAVEREIKKSYIIATLVAEKIQDDFIQNMFIEQRDALASEMSQDELNDAKKIAAQCISKLTDACY